MGWLRDNWLDALIFVLFALVVAGVVLFLTGVNPFARPPASPAQATPVQTPPPASQPPSQAPAAVNPPVQVIPVLPKAPSETPSPTPAPAPTQPAPARPSPAATPTPRPAPATGGWRVAVGAFSDAVNANRLADSLRAQGYAVQLEPAGSVTRVVLGPFPSEERARAVAQELSQYETRVYRGATPTSAAPSSPTNPGRYLQVGAFRNSASAEALVSQLKAAGYPVVLAREGELIRVRVGPVSEDRLELTKSDLRGLGLSPLEVR
ncbi:SPOR domain-containing protein [Meiothermus sp. Pnk-1]|uniref:SPOR domain-containing protein n=1 Tax=Meiothermus sp. Pnk-1 TaxID=873128 RepID=UPI000D7BFE5A|nr:SPOR domain-containing protein [Meiothermus sp. Pnk-1]PZA08828.1 SPOR domain-containing protein [Meiothermus sp. Pnk-1]